MTDKFNDLDKAFNVDSEIVTEDIQPKVKKIEKVRSSVDDIKKDYEYTRKIIRTQRGISRMSY